MTDADLLKIYESQHRKWLFDNSEKHKFNDYYLLAMREAIRLESIEFAEWVRIKGYVVGYTDGESDFWYNIFDQEQKEMSESDLYNTFLNSFM